MTKFVRLIGRAIRHEPLACAALLLGIVLILWAVLPLPYRWWGAPQLSALGTGLIFLGAVPVFFTPASGTNAWSYLLSEPGGGLSLARTQLFLWAVPAVAIYGGMTIPTGQMLNFPSALAPILTGSVLTTALGSAVNPSDDARTYFGCDPDEVDPRLTDLVEDWKGQGDISRYQFLFLTALGSALLLISWLHDPTAEIQISPDILGLLGASSLGYLGTKTVKKVQMERGVPQSWSGGLATNGDGKTTGAHGLAKGGTGRTNGSHGPADSDHNPATDAAPDRGGASKAPNDPVRVPGANPDR